MMYTMTPRNLGPILLACLLVLQDVHAFSPAARSTSRWVSQSRSTTSVRSSSDDDDMLVPAEGAFSRRSAVSALLTGTAVMAAGLLGVPETASARLEAVNKPELLPAEKGLKVIQTERGKFLTGGQVKRLDALLTATERDTGYRVRVLCQSYPNTPGLAIRDYWDLGKEGQKDDKYVVLVVDQFGGRGNVLNFNVGEGVKFALPNVFWTRLQAKFGTVRQSFCCSCCLFGSFTFCSLTFFTLLLVCSTISLHYLLATEDILRPRQWHRLVHYQCYRSYCHLLAIGGSILCERARRSPEHEESRFLV
jgi:hypothetical protein